MPPVDFTGGKTSPYISLRNHSHVSILLQMGVSAAAAMAIQVNAATDNAGTNAQAIPFDLFACETANTDVLGPRLPQAAAGYGPSANDNIFYVLEIESAQLPQGFDHVALKVVNGANSIIGSAVAILSGARYANDQSDSVLI
jgi:hypothetical protein